jgi:hypothetical protein
LIEYAEEFELKAEWKAKEVKEEEQKDKMRKIFLLIHKD